LRAHGQGPTLADGEDVPSEDALAEGVVTAPRAKDQSRAFTEREDVPADDALAALRSKVQSPMPAAGEDVLTALRREVADGPDRIATATAEGGVSYGALATHVSASATALRAKGQSPAIAEGADVLVALRRQVAAGPDRIAVALAEGSVSYGALAA